MAKFLYAHRPSKHVQRKMIVDACRRLDRIAPLGTYRFVGFGAYEFVDFELFRRELGVVVMDSIELDTARQKRYLFNRPFDHIEVHFDRASNVLPDLLDDSGRRIVWLDYLGGVDHEVLSDVGTCVRKLAPGSILVITVGARPRGPFAERRANLAADVGEARVPAHATDAYLGPHFADVQRDIVAASIPEQLRYRDDAAAFTQLFDIRYTDSTPMQTWGGLLAVDGDPSAAAVIAECDALEQTSLPGQPPVRATVPPLTTREVLYLNRQLPSQGVLQGEDIPDAELTPTSACIAGTRQCPRRCSAGNGGPIPSWAQTSTGCSVFRRRRAGFTELHHSDHFLRWIRKPGGGPRRSHGSYATASSLQTERPRNRMGSLLRGSGRGSARLGSCAAQPQPSSRQNAKKSADSIPANAPSTNQATWSSGSHKRRLGGSNSSCSRSHEMKFCAITERS